ncbi:MFS transporter small subunit [Tersicoccus solisilvae]
MRARLIIGWTLVAVPLLYGIVNTLSRAADLFR